MRARNAHLIEKWNRAVGDGDTLEHVFANADDKMAYAHISHDDFD